MKKREKTILTAITLCIIFIFLAIFLDSVFEKPVITNFEECEKAGYPIMESHPRQCRADGLIFIEDIEIPIGGDKDEYGCLVAAGYRWNNTDQRCVREWEKNHCTLEQKNAEACISLYDPVCGYPTKQTFSNSCMACMNSKVNYWIKGECEEDK